LIEIAVVTLIISILAAILVPNLLQLRDRAREAAVKSNMHTIQLAMEDFGVQTGGTYADAAGSVTPSGQTVEALCPDGVYPTNPFTQAATNVAWDADPLAAGEIGINPANPTDYVVKGYGRSILLQLELYPGR
jgi:type II secretory pathway pseudopilin PulG